MSLVTQAVNEVLDREITTSRAVAPPSGHSEHIDVDAELEKILAPNRSQLSPKEEVERLLRVLGARNEAGAFYRENHARLLAYALKAMRNCANAEDVLSQTVVGLLEGHTDIRLFPNALRADCINMNRRLAYQARVTRSTDVVREGLKPGGQRTMSWTVGEVAHVEGRLEHDDSRDPLDVLIGKEEEAEKDRLVSRAMKDPRWRFCKRKKWARPLVDISREEGTARLPSAVG